MKSLVKTAGAVQSTRNGTGWDGLVMSEAETPKKLGRPLKTPGEGKRPTITFRCRGPLHERIQASARTADRSISEEVETRLDRSYEADDRIKDSKTDLVSATKEVILDILYSYVGGSQNFYAGQRFAHALKHHQDEADAKFRSEDPWYVDEDKKKYVKDKVSGLIDFIVDQLAEETNPDLAERRKVGGESAPQGRNALSALGVLADPKQGKDASEI